MKRVNVIKLFLSIITKCDLFSDTLYDSVELFVADDLIQVWDNKNFDLTLELVKSVGSIEIFCTLIKHSNENPSSCKFCFQVDSENLSDGIEQKVSDLFAVFVGRTVFGEIEFDKDKTLFQNIQHFFSTAWHYLPPYKYSLREI